MNIEEFFDLDNDNEETKVSVSMLDKIYKMWMEYDDKISKIEFIRDLIKEKFLKTVKELNVPDILSENIINYVSSNRSQENARILKHRLNFEFGEVKWLLKDITYLGEEIYGFGIPFSLNYKRYRIEAPCFKNLTLSNMHSMSLGMFSLYVYNNNHALTQIYSSRSKEEIAEYIKKLSKNDDTSKGDLK